MSHPPNPIPGSAGEPHTDRTATPTAVADNFKARCSLSKIDPAGARMFWGERSDNAGT